MYILRGTRDRHTHNKVDTKKYCTTCRVLEWLGSFLFLPSENRNGQRIFNRALKNKKNVPHVSRPRDVWLSVCVFVSSIDCYLLDDGTDSLSDQIKWKRLFFQSYFCDRIALHIFRLLSASYEFKTTPFVIHVSLSPALSAMAWEMGR